MKTYNNLWEKICSLENLDLAYRKARKGKTKKDYVRAFEKDLKNNLCLLRTELLLNAYRPLPLKAFIICDPKTRRISKSEFRDRIIHHALCNIIEPIFEKRFIYDSYANRKGKGVFKALERFDFFKQKITPCGHVLKADIRHYFDEIDHDVLLQIIQKKIKDIRVIWLICQILNNHSKTKGMPLGNLTSQFFANVYLNELDQFVKNKLKVRYYIRYVDDFIILGKERKILEKCKSEINIFLQDKLHLALHPEKSKIKSLKQGVLFLGFRNFYYHRLLRKTSRKKILLKLESYKQQYDQKKIDYNKIYDCAQGWIAYARHANTRNLRKRIAQLVDQYFPNELSTTEINRLLKILS